MENIQKFSSASVAFRLDESPTITISFAALAQIKESAYTSRRVETGGILVGFDAGRDIQIVAASDAGPGAKRTQTHFLRDTVYCREFLSRWYRESGADYVGEWHSHVVNLRQLSGGDLGTLAGILVDPDYDFVTFAAVLVVVGKEEPELFVYSVEPSRESYGSRIVVTNLHRGKFPEPRP
jgi:integrative and conjugative element protein (TIGR02256 family)